MATAERPMSDATSVMDSARNTARDAAASVADRAEQMWDRTTGMAQHLHDDPMSTIGDALGAVRDCMSRYPVAVFFAGLGCGFFLARALDNRHT
jgi:hypothetical protein